ncbi:IclR family transcriptional regulator [Arvimicrobium flavum]|uniref:IclR family transcriptional regulator n=1 Tax=Arvimicrobium flavum TaxID=3393320 RepID=UPI0030842084
MREGQDTQSHAASVQEQFAYEGESATVKSAKRVLQILELFKEMRRPLSTTEIAMELSFPISSTAALLKSLTSLGYLHFDRTSRTYQAGLRVGLLGGWRYGGRFAPETLTEVTRGLAEKTGQTIIVGLRNENHIQYVSVVASHARVRYYLPVGSRQRLVDTPMGRALLSLDENAAIDRLVRRANADRNDNQQRIDPVEIRAEIAEIRRLGHACSNRPYFQGARAIAVPLRMCGSEPPLVLGLGGPAEEIELDKERLVDLVRAAALQICTGNVDAEETSQTAQPLFA